jgi:hypothetical protein
MSAPSTLLLLPAAFLLGALVTGLLARRRFTREELTFACKVRWTDDVAWPALARWPRWRARAVWMHDVLIVHQGILRPHTTALPARNADRAIQATCRAEVPGLGAAPVVLTLNLDDGRRAEVAAREADLNALAGPFVTAALPRVPRAPA